MQRRGSQQGCKCCKLQSYKRKASGLWQESSVSDWRSKIFLRSKRVYSLHTQHLRIPRLDWSSATTSMSLIKNGWLHQDQLHLKLGASIIVFTPDNYASQRSSAILPFEPSRHLFVGWLLKLWHSNRECSGTGLVLGISMKLHRSPFKHMLAPPSQFVPCSSDRSSMTRLVKVELLKLEGLILKTWAQVCAYGAYAVTYFKINDSFDSFDLCQTEIGVGVGSNCKILQGLKEDRMDRHLTLQPPLLLRTAVLAGRLRLEFPCAFCTLRLRLA